MDSIPLEIIELIRSFFCDEKDWVNSFLINRLWKSGYSFKNSQIRKLSYNHKMNIKNMKINYKLEFWDIGKLFGHTLIHSSTIETPSSNTDTIISKTNLICRIAQDMIKRDIDVSYHTSGENQNLTDFFPVKRFKETPESFERYLKQLLEDQHPKHTLRNLCIYL
jgi:hypothetical protein